MRDVVPLNDFVIDGLQFRRTPVCFRNLLQIRKLTTCESHHTRMMHALHRSSVSILHGVIGRKSEIRVCHVGYQLHVGVYSAPTVDHIQTEERPRKHCIQIKRLRQIFLPSNQNHTNRAAV